MFCPKCGSNLEEGDRFCRECGAPVNQASDNTEKSNKHTEILSDVEKSKSEVSAAMESKQIQVADQPEPKEFPDAGGNKEVRHTGSILRKVIIISVISIIFLFLAGFGLVKFSNATTVRNDMKLGNKYLEEGKYEEAIIAFSKIIKIDKKNIQARVDLGKAYIATGKNNEAEKILKEAISIDAKKYEPYVELAKLYISLGEIDKASKILAQGYTVTTNDNIKKLQDEIAAKYVRGNTVGNLLNGGFLAVQGDWIYGGDFDGNYIYGGLYKYKKDGANKVKLSDDSVRFVNVVGDWIYYYGNNDGIYKIKTDGTSHMRLSQNNVWCVTVAGDWIYYCDFPNNGEAYLYKMKTDGTQITKLCSDNVGCFAGAFINVIGDWVYYTNMSDNGNTYKVKTDGTGRAKCSFSGVNIAGNWAYYDNEKDGYKLYKMNMDGTGSTKLCEDSACDINVSGDWIYYLKSTGENRYKLCKIKTDGTSSVEISNDEIYFITFENDIGPQLNVAGDWIFYDNYPDESTCEFYRIKTDGTGRKLIYQGSY